MKTLKQEKLNPISKKTTHCLVELVCHNLDDLLTEAKNCKSRFSTISGFNIPDIKRLDTRSYEASQHLSKAGFYTIPHLRTKDFTKESLLSCIETLYENNVKTFLLITGDVFNGEKKNGLKPVEALSYIKSKRSDITLYAGIDPYRQPFEKEQDYIQEKLDAGADGFFTQPFFDDTLLKTYLDRLKDLPVFVGLSPVLSEKSKQYWEKVNKVVFSDDFKTSLEYHLKTSQNIIKTVQHENQSIYLMPIKMPALEYLSALKEHTPLFT